MVSPVPKHHHHHAPAPVETPHGYASVTEEFVSPAKGFASGGAGAIVESSVAESTVAESTETPARRPHPLDNPMTINWGPAIWLIVLHVLALGAPFYFSWSGLGLAVLFHWMAGSLGICLGFHRLLTHTGMDMPGWLRNVFATIGTLAGEGGPISWCSNHRKHHAFSDQVGDPHSPKDGPWWSHIYWLAFNTDGGDRAAYVKKWVPDLIKDKYLVFLEDYFLPIHIAFGALVTLAGYIVGSFYPVGGFYLATSWFLWAICLRHVALLHTTWFVNSASHIWGYRNYETRDESRNLWWVGLIAYGEGWHNNHHARPRLAQHGHKWWEFDMTYQFICMLRFFGLAKNVVDLKSVADKKQRFAEEDHQAA
jgi:stearoyl-CoA desaturase (delta-9 desaturase)